MTLENTNVSELGIISISLHVWRNGTRRDLLNPYFIFIFSSGWLKAKEREEENRLLQQHAHGKEDQQC